MKSRIGSFGVQILDIVVNVECMSCLHSTRHLNYFSLLSFIYAYLSQQSTYFYTFKGLIYFYGNGTLLQLLISCSLFALIVSSNLYHVTICWTKWISWSTKKLPWTWKRQIRWRSMNSASLKITKLCSCTYACSGCCLWYLPWGVRNVPLINHREIASSL